MTEAQISESSIEAIRERVMARLYAQAAVGDDVDVVVVRWEESGAVVIVEQKASE